MPVPRLCILLAALSAALIAQPAPTLPPKDQPYFGMQKVIDGILAQQKFGPSLSPLDQRVFPTPSTQRGDVAPILLKGNLPGMSAPCSVPLLQAQIPQGVTFTMQRVPSNDTRDPMPTVLPAPACPSN